MVKRKKIDQVTPSSRGDGSNRCFYLTGGNTDRKESVWLVSDKAEASVLVLHTCLSLRDILGTEGLWYFMC